MQFESNAILIAGAFRIYYYAIIIVTGALLGGYLASLEARRRNINPELAWDALIWILLFGVIGARLYHVLTPTTGLADAYFKDPLTIITGIRNGGLGMLGGVAGGLLGLWLFTRGFHFANKQERAAGKPFLYFQRGVQMRFSTWLDIIAPAVLLAQSVGRWGNYVNQELYGKPTSLPWSIYIDLQHRLTEFLSESTYHPLFFYESVLTLLGCLLLLWLGRRYHDWLKRGDLFLIYILYYGAVRFCLEFLRVDSHHIGSLNTNQLVVGVGMLIAGAFLLIRHQRSLRASSE